MSQGKNTDLKSVIIIRDNDNNNNLFKLVRPQSLEHSERMQAIFKHKTQQTIKTLIEEKRASPANKTSNVDVIKNETPNATGGKARIP